MLELIRALPADAAKLVSIKRKAYRDEDRNFENRNGSCLAFIGNKAFIHRCMQNYELYKIQWKQKIIGTLWLDHETDHRPNCLEIQDFCILPKFQNQGFGHKTMQMLEAIHPEVKIWKLSVSPFSIRNQHVYEKAGYQLVKTEKNCLHYEKQIE